ncbi:B-cell receptor-associated protein 31-like-domain-containing protein [Blastocladiella britannica]|nr:B-cell receptor-associated protein 31-like-domain-containing protein [Blastocladiella britannica]
MSIPYQITFYLLIAEISVLLLLSVPLPNTVRKFIVNVTTSNLFQQGLFWFRIGVAFVGILFADSYIRMMGVGKEFSHLKDHSADGHHHHQPVSAETEANLKSKLFYAQRNVYITGFTLLLAILLNRMVSLISEVLNYEAKSNVVVKQAANNNKQLSELVDNASKTEAEIIKLRADLAAAEKMSADAAVIKKQADNNNAQYMELADRYAALEKRAARVAEEHGIALDEILGGGKSAGSKTSYPGIAGGDIDLRRRSGVPAKKEE